MIDEVTGRVAEMGVALPPGRAGLQAAVRKVLDAMIADGSLADGWAAHLVENVTLPAASGTP